MKRRPIDLRLLSMAGILVVMWVLFRLKTGPYYFSGESIAHLTRDMATWTILAAGMTLVLPPAVATTRTTGPWLIMR